MRNPPDQRRRAPLAGLLPALLLICLPITARAAGPVVHCRQGAVVSIHPLASQAGLDQLRQGGNAIDAAVATGFALAVVHPSAGNLGGGGFLVARLPDKGAVTLDFRETAPGGAHRDMFLDGQGRPRPQASLVGPLAAGVPGTPAGLLMALERWGSRPRAKVLEPAIVLAEKGFIVDHHLARSLARPKIAALMTRFPATAGIFYPRGRPLAAGTRLVQPALAATLKLIRDRGRAGFYQGRTAELIQACCRAGGGIITTGDLDSYRARVGRPLTGRWRDLEVLVMPPPSSGGVCLLQMLAMVDSRLPAPGDAMPGADHVHLLAQAMRLAFADRATWLGDPDSFPVPLAGLLDRGYLHKRARAIATGVLPGGVGPGRPAGAPTNGAGGPKKEGDQTTHYSVVDRWGGAVAVTTTLNSAYGAKCVVAGAGFLLNNEMDDFSIKPGEPNQFGLVGGQANAIAPGRRMLSSMTPTIVTRKGRVVLVLGSPGGPRIINTVFQVMVNHLALGMDLRRAVALPRWHQQWRPPLLFHEKYGCSPEVGRVLQARGWQLEVLDPIGRCQAIGRDKKGTWCAVADPRGRAGACGY